MEFERESEALHGALAAYLARLRAKDAFAGESERIKWVWRLHRLRRRRQLAPALWSGAPSRLLAEIEAAIERLPTGDARHTRVSIDFDLSDEGDEEEKKEEEEQARASAGDRGSIPMMETERSVAEDDASSWTSMAQLLRRASSVFLGSTPLSGRDSLPGLRDSVALVIHEEEEKQGYAAADDDPSFERDGGGQAFAAAASASSINTQLLKLETDSPKGRYDSPTDRGESEGSSRGLRQSVPGLLRSIASYMGLSMEETFLCQICFDYAPVSTAMTLTNCQHSFCRACLQNYLEFKVSEAQVYPTCFFQPKGEAEGACAAEIAVDDIRAVVSDEAWEKYTKFKFNKENELARQCPFCDHSQVCAGPDEPACTCDACGREYCFLHSNAHEGRSCAAYEKKMLAVEKLNHALISEIAKPCPGCQSNVEKTGGCNQMKCVVCNTSFCWICLAVIDDHVFPEHFQWWNVRGCAGNQMADLEQQSRTDKVVQTVFRLGFFVVFGPPALVLAVVTCVLCCFFTPCTANGRMTFRHAFSSCFCISGYALLAPFVLAAGLAVLGIALGGAAAAVALVLALSPLLCMLALVKCDSFRSWRSR